MTDNDEELGDRKMSTLLSLDESARLPYGYLSKVNRQVDFVQLHAPGKGWTLPPCFCPVDGKRCRVHFIGPCWVAHIADLKCIQEKKLSFANAWYPTGTFERLRAVTLHAINILMTLPATMKAAILR